MGNDDGLTGQLMQVDSGGCNQRVMGRQNDMGTVVPDEKPLDVIGKIVVNAGCKQNVK